jgi:hypothetical protein
MTAETPPHPQSSPTVASLRREVRVACDTDTAF